MPTGNVVSSLGGDMHSLSETRQVTFRYESYLKFEINDGVTDQEEEQAINFADMVGFIAKSDRAVTLETENATTPTDTIALVADRCTRWMSPDSGNPLTADVTKWFATNASGSKATVEILALIN